MSQNLGDALERRGFFARCGVGAISLPVLNALDTAAADAPSADKPRRVSCKITVLKTTLNKEYVDRFRNGKGEACPVFRAGQEFVLQSPWETPQGFCSWAWADIRAYILATSSGRSDAFPPPSGNAEGTFVACCSDGFRPVFFSIERIEA